ncbi:hypothetical protein RB2150_10249 [Rhodobacterales bacterium HTCC2150]|nr:hypothetical protein RB2150_10249 [Rhodobacterales bacterium HTCC2150] [Rhodobacteraceae bacterium HTCC2150]
MTILWVFIFEIWALLEGGDYESKATGIIAIHPTIDVPFRLMS